MPMDLQPRRMRTPACARVARESAKLRLEQLEDREVPALNILLDYSFDTNGFFNDPSRRAVLQQAVNEVAARVDQSLGAIAPTAANTWTATFYNPATGYMQSVSNPTIPANTLLVYVGGRDLNGSEAGVGGFGGWSGTGTSSWISYIPSRGTSGFAPWGGSLAFDSNGTNWNSSLTSVPSNAIDLYSVAQHELGHLLGIGTSPTWFNQISGGAFQGASATSLYGSPVPVSANGAHWADGVKGFGCFCPSCTGAAAAATAQASLAPTLPFGQRVGFSELDFAALRDIGWKVSAPNAVVSPPVTPVSPPPVSLPTSPPPAPVPAFNPVTAAAPADNVAISGGGGLIQIFRQGTNGQLQAVTSPIRPFGGYNGIVRSAVGDFNGDGIQDLAVGTAAGATATVMIYNGKDYSLLLGPTVMFGGFTGGVFLAAGDVDRDGNDELAISCDAGSTPRVSIFDIRNGQAALMCDFIAFDSPSFRGGARVSMGDINKDGYADLVVTAGPGGGPRVSTYSGASLMRGRADRLIWDFYAFDPKLRTGAYVAAADLNNDGYAEIIFSADDGGSSRTIAYSGWLLTSRPGIDPMTLPFLFSQFSTLENSSQGTRVSIKDLDGDGRNEMIFTTAARTDSSLRILTSDQILSVHRPEAKVQMPIGTAIDVKGLYLG